MHPQSRGCKRAGPFEGAQTSKNAAKLQRGALIRLHRSLLHGAVLPHEFCVEDRVLDQRRRVGAKQLSIEASLERDGAPTLVLRGWKAPAFVQPHKELVIHVVIFLIVPFAAHRRHSARCAGGSCALQCHSLPVETRLKLSGTGRFSTVPVAFRPPRYTPLAQIDLNATFRRPLALPPLSGLCAGRTESEKRDSRANRVFARCETVADSPVVSSSRGHELLTASRFRSAAQIAHLTHRAAHPPGCLERWFERAARHGDATFPPKRAWNGAIVPRDSACAHEQFYAAR